MKSLVIYDSNYGNTKQIAEVIARELDTKAIPVTDVVDLDLVVLDLLIVGCPINGWRPSEKMGLLLASLKKGELARVKVAAFDTRVTAFFHGDAARRIAKVLKRSGATVIAKPQGFFVEGTKGPLVAGEEEKARIWAREVKQHV